jgi:uncharacterized protein YqcC (DUF446 family)
VFGWVCVNRVQSLLGKRRPLPNSLILVPFKEGEVELKGDGGVNFLSMIEKRETPRKIKRDLIMIF